MKCTILAAVLAGAFASFSPAAFAATLLQGKQLAPNACSTNLGFVPLAPANNLSDLSSVSTARAMLSIPNYTTSAIFAPMSSQLGGL
jgi:hypothetical protein